MSVSQTEFRTALLDPAAAVPEGLTDPEGHPSPRRFAVYRNNVAVGLTDALEAAFPVIRALVGAEFFRAMAGVFLRAHPPASPLMMFYGAEMPAFLTEFAPVAHLPYLPDVARLELALRESYHATDTTPIIPATFATLPPDRLAATRLRIAPAVRLIPSLYPLHGLWAMNATGAAAPVHRAEWVLVTRPGYDPRPHPLTPGAGAIAARLLSGDTLGTAVEAGTVVDLAALLPLLLSEGAIAALD